ncbi:MAG: methylenetetrahydrofolate reductase C-terminal domain-containing protein [Heliobacteriaceae bacterium]|nr:methylenetetrahydrofolate reductase C-terminal domain-containing protein [Heliobacteriaceae bacterium]MDD4586821.1 methylenetetrahydrofolate reductase C-terminal domain-containing protein [Heliobacteriaceae bacterium]
MIVAEQKPLVEIAERIKEANKVLIVGCSMCVTVCLAGGEKEVGVLAAALRLLRAQTGRSLETVEYTATRQCDQEYLEAMAKIVTPDIDLIISMACGVGVQYVAERFDQWTIPALNTKLIGGTLEHGVWEERCGLCGDCVLHKTGGICPIIRCSKSILNGPCGGSQNGKCEISPTTPCAWQLIYDKMAKLGKLEALLTIEPVKDWSKARDGGPRRVVKEDVAL